MLEWKGVGEFRNGNNWKKHDSVVVINLYRVAGQEKGTASVIKSHANIILGLTPNLRDSNDDGKLGSSW